MLAVQFIAFQYCNVEAWNVCPRRDLARQPAEIAFVRCSLTRHCSDARESRKYNTEISWLCMYVLSKVSQGLSDRMKLDSRRYDID